MRAAELPFPVDLSWYVGRGFKRCDRCGSDRLVGVTGLCVDCRELGAVG